MSARPDRREEPQTEEATDFSEDYFALAFTETHPGYRWVQTWGHWYRWTGEVWETDTTLAVYDAVRKYLRDSSWMTQKPNVLLKAATIAAVERLARSDRRYAATSEQWDADQWLLNTPAGIVDLKTGELREHDPEAYCTMITRAAPGAAPHCPTCWTWGRGRSNYDSSVVIALALARCSRRP